VNALPGHAQEFGDRSGGLAAVDLEQRHRAAVGAGVAGVLQLPAELAALGGGQL
jgi:hypothetical protein